MAEKKNPNGRNKYIQIRIHFPIWKRLVDLKRHTNFYPEGFWDKGIYGNSTNCIQEVTMFSFCKPFVWSVGTKNLSREGFEIL